MTSESPVRFKGAARAHVALGVADLERSMAFYEVLLGTAPTKVRPGYARFEVEVPPLNLALNATPSAVAAPLPSHFGIQVKSTRNVDEAARRLSRAGLATRVEESETCCYAVQDKVWVADPDGNRWEIFVVLDDSETRDGESSECCGTSACCSTSSEGDAAYRESAGEKTRKDCC